MEAYKLQIGDWFKFGDENIQVTYINCRPDFQDTPPTNEIGWGTNEDNTYINAKKAQPIKATADVLKALGFTSEDGALVYYPKFIKNKELCYIECHCRRNGDVRMVEICNNHKSFKIDLAEVIWLHDIQQGMRICGLDKLANEITVQL